MWSRLLVLGRDAGAVAERVRAALPRLDVTAHPGGDVPPAAAAAAEMILGFRVPPPLRPHLTRLRWIQSTGAGVDGVLAGGGIADDVLVTRVQGVFGRPMAEYVLCRCLAIAQELPRLDQDRRARRWRPFAPRPLADLRVTVLGTGAIGAEVARTLLAHGVQVRGVNRGGRPPPGLPGLPVAAAATLDDVLPATDVLVIVLPATPATERLIDARRLALLPPGAWLVNVARGSIVDEAALVAALAGGRLGGAALDVFAVEPLPDDSPLWDRDDVLLSPHVAGLTSTAEAADAFTENWRRLAAGRPPVGVVDRATGY